MAERAPLILQQFARLPRVGEVKTRLHSALGAEGACEVHSELLTWTCRSLLRSGLGPVELWLDREGEHPVIATCLAEGAVGPWLQTGADLGARMLAALDCGLQRAAAVVLVGSDCPQLDRGYLQQAAALLASHDCVLGPALDGGFVLIGARRTESDWFRGVTWGSDTVYRRTADNLAASGASWAALPPRRDIDRPEDLALWRALSGA